MYDAVADPYCYPGTTVLINKLDLRDQRALEAFEAEITSQRATEPLPSGVLDASHYLSIHAHLFQDVYEWAGRVRTVRIAKDGSMFCFPDYIETELSNLFDGLSASDHFRNLPPAAYAASAARFLSELNAIHAFREGNGRTQLSFLALLSDHAGHRLDLTKMSPETMLAAMIWSFEHDDRKLEAAIVALLG